MANLNPTEKMQLGQAYTFTFVVDSVLPALDSTVERQINTAFVNVENARVNRPLLSDDITVTFTWRGPQQTVLDAANNIILAASPVIGLQFRSATSGILSQEDLPCSERGPVDSILCGIEKNVKQAGAVLIGLGVLLVVAIVVVAFSPAGKEAVKKIPRVTSG